MICLKFFDLFQLSNKQIKDVVKKEESSIKGDFILEIKNIDDESIQEILQDELFEKTNSDLLSKYVGSYLGTSPNYIKESYQMTVNYALLLSRHLATKNNENFNIKYAYNNLKDSKESIYDKLAKFVL